MIKTPSCYPRWQQYNTCLAAPTVTGKGHRKMEPKAKHFSHCKKDQSSRPNQTDNSKRLAKITQLYVKEFREDSNIFIDKLDHKPTIHRSQQTHRKKKITSNRSQQERGRTLYRDPKREKKPSS